MDLDSTDKQFLNLLQTDFPLARRPFEVLGAKLGETEAATIERGRRLKTDGIVRQIGAIFDTRKLGYRSSLVAMAVKPERLDDVADRVSGHPGVSHNYGRDHRFNLWFTIAVPPGHDLDRHIARLAAADGVESTRVLPTIKVFKIGVKLDVAGDSSPTDEDAPDATRDAAPVEITDEVKRIVMETQEDLAIEAEPFAAMCGRLGLAPERLFEKLLALQPSGVLRRYAAVLRHRKAGFTENVMAVWAAPEERVDELGPILGSARAVSHCYRRPTYPDWPYNLFTMIHARSREEAEQVIDSLSKSTGLSTFSRLRTTKEYKKIRLKYFTPDIDAWEKAHPFSGGGR